MTKGELRTDCSDQKAVFATFEITGNRLTAKKTTEKFLVALTRKFDFRTF
jgi:hypothetical protein